MAESESREIVYNMVPKFETIPRATARVALPIGFTLQLKPDQDLARIEAA